MVLVGVVFIKWKGRIAKRPEIEVEKKKLREPLLPSYDWMLKYKIKADGTILKSEYRTVGRWLKEYYHTEKRK